MCNTGVNELITFHRAWSLFISRQSTDSRSDWTHLQTVLLQLVGPQLGHRRGAVPGMGHPSVLQRPECRVTLQRGPAHLVCHLQHRTRQHHHGCFPVSMYISGDGKVDFHYGSSIFERRGLLTEAVFHTNRISKLNESFSP